MNVTVRCLTMSGEVIGAGVVEVVFTKGRGYPERPVVVHATRDGHLDRLEADCLGKTINLPLLVQLPPYVYAGNTITLQFDGPMLSIHA